MNKTSTFLYSINNLSSKIQHTLIPADDLEGQKEYDDVFELLAISEQYDVKQEVVNNIMNFAKQTSDDE